MSPKAAPSVKPSRWSGYPCPENPAHGTLIDAPDGAKFAYWCTHRDHDGSSERPRTRFGFTKAEAEAGKVTA